MISDENLRQLREMMASLLEEYGLRKPAALAASNNAERQRRFRERKRNAESNRKVTRTKREKRNGVHNAIVTDESPIIITIPLNDGTEYGVSQKTLKDFEGLYPAVDVPQTLREIKGWNLADPSRRKTRRGVMKHINGWLAKEQNKG